MAKLWKMGLANASPIIDPQKLWQTLKKFDYPFFIILFIILALLLHTHRTLLFVLQIT